jgi:hypothetical protein
MARREAVVFTVQQTEGEKDRWDIISRWPGRDDRQSEKQAERLGSYPEAMHLLGQIANVAIFMGAETVLGANGQVKWRWTATQPICSRHYLPLPDGEYKCWRCRQEGSQP